jgi:hypothetical protein
MVYDYNTTQQTPHPLLATHRLYILYFDFGKGGRAWEMNREKVSGARVHKAESKIPTADYISPVYKLY